MHKINKNKYMENLVKRLKELTKPTDSELQEVINITIQRCIEQYGEVIAARFTPQTPELKDIMDKVIDEAMASRLPINTEIITNVIKKEQDILLDEYNKKNISKEDLKEILSIFSDFYNKGFNNAV